MNINIDINLTPVYHSEYPEIRIKFNDDIIFCGALLQSRTFTINKQVQRGNQKLSVEFYNKKDNDTIVSQGLDKAVIINSITLNNITDPKFIWSGIYQPEYPEPWATEQKNAGVHLETELTNTNYLGWNGEWSLVFSTPVFTWIHQLQNLGWIYE